MTFYNSELYWAGFATAYLMCLIAITISLIIINKVRKTQEGGNGMKEERTDVTHKKQTDEEVYQMLKKIKGKEGFMDADEWKEKRLKQLKKEGHLWSK